MDENDGKIVPWPNLPRRLIKHIQKNPILMQTINFGTVTKSWRTPAARQYCNPNQAHPWLCVMNDDNIVRKRHDGQFCSISFPRDSYFYSRCYKRLLSRRPHMKFTGCSHGHLIARSSTSTSKFHVVEPVENMLRTLPEFYDGLPFKCAAISSQPPHFGSWKSWNVMVATGISSPAFLCYNLRGRRGEWIKQDCTVTEPNHHSNGKQSQGADRFMQFTNVIGFQGRFYALSSQGTLAMVEQVGVESGCFEIAALGKTRAVPSVPSRSFRECLIESDGELLLVFLICKKTLDAVDDLEVFRLHFDELSWIKMGSLGGRTLFIGSDCCISVCAIEAGCRANCVYFTQRGNDGWWEYDMEVGIISPVWSEANSSCTIKTFEWDEPITEVFAK